MSKGLTVVVCNLYSSNTTTRQNISHSIPQIICYIVVLKVLKPCYLELDNLNVSGKMSGLENINWTLAVYYDALDLLIKSNCIQVQHYF